MITVTQGVETSAANLSKIWDWLNSPRLPNYDDFNSGDKLSEMNFLADHMHNRQTFGAMLGKELVGLICFLPTNPVSGWFQGVIVDPKVRHKGIGSEFLYSVVSTLRNKGFRTLTAGIFADNIHMQHVFKKCGAVRTGYIPRTTMRDGVLVDHVLYSFTENSVMITPKGGK